MRAAFLYIKEAFPGVPDDQVRMLLNTDAKLLSPGNILIREGDKNKDIFLILSGYLEMIRTASGVGPSAATNGAATQPSTGDPYGWLHKVG